MLKHSAFLVHDIFWNKQNFCFILEQKKFHAIQSFGTKYMNRFQSYEIKVSCSNFFWWMQNLNLQFCLSNAQFIIFIRIKIQFVPENVDKMFIKVEQYPIRSYVY